MQWMTVTSLVPCQFCISTKTTVYKVFVRPTTSIIYMLWTKWDIFNNTVRNVNSLDTLSFDTFSTHIRTTLTVSLLHLCANNNLQNMKVNWQQLFYVKML